MRDADFAEGLARLTATLYAEYMSQLRARVENGRLVLDEPTTLPEGTVIDLVADDEGDDLSEFRTSRFE